jgi:glycosyltransferase involved in cell wall biosynthesis
MPQVSIIIPNYNNNLYLKDAILSARNQTLKDIEILIIDDCSTDDISQKIITEQAAEDSRIKTFSTQTNSGVSVARNIGIDNATGDYLMFLDSDDCLYATAAESMLIAAIANDSELVVGNYSFISDNFKYTPAVAGVNNQVGGCKMSSTFIITKFIKDVDFGVMPIVCWGKLFRKNLFEEMRFTPGIYPNEDVDFMLRMYSYISTASTKLEDTVMFYRRSATSIIQHGMNPKFAEGWRQAIMSVIKFLQSNPTPAKRDFKNFTNYYKFIGRYIFVMIQSMLMHDVKTGIEKDMYKIVTEMYMTGIFRDADITDRVRFGLKLYVSGAHKLARNFLIFNYQAIGKL